MSNPVSLALSEVVTAMRAQGDFNDRSVTRAFKNVADTLEQRAWDIDPTTKPKAEKVEPEKDVEPQVVEPHRSHPLVPHSSPVVSTEKSHQ